MVIPGGLHARWHHQRTGMRMIGEYHQFYRDWLPDSGCLPADSEGYMEYHGDLPLGADQAEFTADIFIPVMPL